MYCTLNVKGAHQLFPRLWLEKRLTNHSAGTTIVLQAVISFNGVPVKIMAIGYKYSKSKMRQFFVSTYGSTAGGVPYTCRFRDAKGTPCSKPVFRPMVLVKYWELANKIDVFNMVRQGQLRLEKTWLTMNPHTRLITTTFAKAHVGSLYARNLSAKERMAQKDFTACTSVSLCEGVAAAEPTAVAPIGLSHTARKVQVQASRKRKRAGDDDDDSTATQCTICSTLFSTRARSTIRCMQCNQCFCRRDRLCWDHHVAIGKGPACADDTAWAHVKRAGYDKLTIE